MIDIRLFESAERASAFLDTFLHYEDPAAVTPLKGEAAHEVAVGPVHAGVIEPGHFRFQCMGEDVYNLQIFLGYQHRGVEECIVAAEGNRARQIALAETCAGDTSIAAATCFAEIIEAREALAVAPEALRLRTVLLELERIANHTGDLGALAGDVAFLPTASFCGRIRGEFLNMTALFCGNRFGRGAVVPGGVSVRTDSARYDEFAPWFNRTCAELDHALKLMFREPTVTERFAGTGRVSAETARAIGLVGTARRASEELNGDVLSRALMRRTEIEEARKRIAAALASAPIAPRADARMPVTGHAVVVATVNAWRGPLVHAARFEDGILAGYRIVDPSAHNWQGLAFALRGEQISNFPICNKSFNLSYCGTDR